MLGIQNVLFKYLWVLNFCTNFSNGTTTPLRESLLLLCGGKEFAAQMMSLTVCSSFVCQFAVSYISTKYSGNNALQVCIMNSAMVILTTCFGVEYYSAWLKISVTLFYLWFTFFNMTSTSIYWAIGINQFICLVLTLIGLSICSIVCIQAAGDLVSKDDAVMVFSKISSAGSLGYLAGSLLASYLLSFKSWLILCTLALLVGFSASVVILRKLLELTGTAQCGDTNDHQPHNSAANSFMPTAETAEQYKDLDRITVAINPTTKVTKAAAVAAIEAPISPAELSSTASKIKKQTGGTADMVATVTAEVGSNLEAFRNLLASPALRQAFVYTALSSAALGLTAIERSAAGKASGMKIAAFGSSIAFSQIWQGLLQSFVQAFVAGRLIRSLGTQRSLVLASAGRLVLFLALTAVQSQRFPALSACYLSAPAVRVSFVLFGDAACKLLNLAMSKPLRESLWTGVAPALKYRAKVFIDVFAYRVGTTLAAVLSTHGATAAMALQTIVNAMVSHASAVVGLSSMMDKNTVWVSNGVGGVRGGSGVGSGGGSGSGVGGGGGGSCEGVGIAACDIGDGASDDDGGGVSIEGHVAWGLVVALLIIRSGYLLGAAMTMAASPVTSAPSSTKERDPLPSTSSCVSESAHSELVSD